MGLDVLVIDALQYKRHPSHLSLDEALEWIERFAPGKAVSHAHACAARLRDRDGRDA